MMYGFANPLKEAIYGHLLEHDNNKIPIYTYTFILHKDLCLTEFTAETIHSR